MKTVSILLALVALTANVAVAKEECEGESLSENNAWYCWMDGWMDG